MGDAIRERPRIDVDEPRNAFARLIGDSGDDGVRVAMPDQHYIAQILVSEHVHDIGDAGVEIHLPPGEMHALTQAGERHRVDAVSRRAQRLRDIALGPAADPHAGDKDKGCHSTSVSNNGTDSTVAAGDACPVSTAVVTPAVTRNVGGSLLATQHYLTNPVAARRVSTAHVTCNTAMYCSGCVSQPTRTANGSMPPRSRSIAVPNTCAQRAR